MKSIMPFVVLAGLLASPLSAQNPAPPASPPPGAPNPSEDFPPLEKVIGGYEKVVSTVDGEKSFYTIWKHGKEPQLLAELPKDFERQRHFIALTVASGEAYAGLQSGETYVYWRRYGKRLALVEPYLGIRSTGDNESKASVKRLFTDRVILDVPILTEVRNGGPVIDLDALLLDNADKFFGGAARNLKKNLVAIKTAKAFPENVEIALEMPVAGGGGGGMMFGGPGTQDGQLRTFHYSISLIPDGKSYEPRIADERVGYFTTSFADFGKFKEDETSVRYINRWNLEKADANLKLSPPKEPIVFYIEHTTPIRYRRWVRDGILMWNEAFEKVGLIDAIEVRQQDAATKAHMEKDPEDVRYNFVRWLNNGVGTAIGPSRVNPMTGQILDADIILTDGWIRHYWTQYNEILPGVAMEGYSPETMTWLHRHPTWDPRVRLASPNLRESIMAARAKEGTPVMGGHPLGQMDQNVLGNNEFDGLINRYGQKNGLCMAANCKTHGIALHQMMLAMQAAQGEAAKEEPKKEEEKDKDKAKADEAKKPEDAKAEEAKKAEEPKKPEEKKEEPKQPTVNAEGEQMVDGIPENFIGPLLAELVAHEVGHTLGLRHNFKASSIYTLAQINSDEVKGKKPLAGSVMDYLPVNMSVNGGPVQGDYTMIGVGPYDKWAIEYGYTSSKDLKPILSRVSEPELAYATDEDTWGPDPLARRYDFTKDPFAYAENQMRLIRQNRSGIITKFVADGDSWAKARRGYELTLSEQVRTLSMMANWIGGTHVNRDKKGDPKGRAPIEVVPADYQRKVLDFIVANAFVEDAYGLTPELLKYMTVDKWWDNGPFQMDMTESPAYPVHDRVLGVQASILTSLMHPEALEQIYDNELRLAKDQDALTIPELLEKLETAIWGDLEKDAQANGAQFTARQPMISSLRRNLQKEYVERLMDLIGPDTGFSVAQKPIQDLAAMQLDQIKTSIDKVRDNAKIDPYTRAHLVETGKRIGKALDAQYVVPVRAF